MQLSTSVRATHAALSPHNIDFLEAMLADPAALERETFTHLDVVKEEVGYHFQSWPIFVDSAKLQELGRLNAALAKLLGAVPARLIGKDAGRLASFYGLRDDHANLVAVALEDDRLVPRLLGRSDFFYTEEGFRCMEFNLASNIGGWQTSYWADELLVAEPTKRFLAERGLEARSHHVLRNMISYLLRDALKRFKEPEINMIYLLPTTSDGSEVVTHIRVTAELYASILEALGGKITGSFAWCHPDDLERRGNLLVHEGRRIHVVLDGYAGFAGAAATRCWLMGTVELYNGLATPVLTDKRNQALLWEHKDTPLFDDDERRVIEATVPWTRRVSREVLHPQAPPPLSEAELIARRQELVLKPSGESGGRDVHIGRITDETAWREVVERAFDDGSWIAQQLLISRPHLFQAGEKGCAEHDVVWSFYVFGGRFSGLFLRLEPKGTGGVVSAGHGATLAAAFEIYETGAG